MGKGAATVKLAKTVSRKLEDGLDALRSDYRARMERAADQGFDTVKSHSSNTVFSGSPKADEAAEYGIPIAQEFSPTKGGIYLSDQGDDVASEVFGATGSNPMAGQADYMVRSGNQFDARWTSMDDHAKRELREAIDSIVTPEDIQDAAARLDIDIDSADPFEMFTDGEFYQGYGRDTQDQLLDSLHKRGYDSVIFPDMLAGGDKSVSTVVFDPKNIRSTNAQFDPTKTDSSNLLAGIGGAAVVGGAALGTDEAEAGPLTAGARRLLDDRFLNALGGSNPRVGLRETVAGMETGVRPRDMDKGASLDLADYEGRPYILTQSDRSAAGGEITSVHGTEISPVDLRGGRDFMFDSPSAGQVWASDPAVVGSLHKRADALSKQHGSDTLILPYSMAPTGIDFATMPLETMVGFAREKMSKTNIKKLDRKIRDVIPEWGGVDDPASVAIFRDVKGPKRKKIADIMDKDFREVPGGMSISEARAATTDKAQYLSPEGQISNAGVIDTSRAPIADSGHPTYMGGLPGEGIGTFDNALDVRPFMANNGRQLTGDAADIRALSMNHGLSQGVIDENLLKAVYGERGNATPEMLAATAALTAGAVALSPYAAEASTALQGLHERRQAKQGVWQKLRAELSDGLTSGADLAMEALQALDGPVQGAIGGFLNSGTGMAMGMAAQLPWEDLEMPQQGVWGLGAAAKAGIEGQGFDQSLQQGANVARQPLDVTAYDVGGSVTDTTGSPALGAAANLGVQFLGGL